MRLVVVASARIARPRSDAGGYTLIELSVVLVVIGLIGAAIPILVPPAARGVDARVAAFALAQDLRAARAMAVYRNEPVAVLFEHSSHSYGTAAGEIGGQLPPEIVLGWPQDATSTEGSSELRFFPDGSSSGGVIELTYRSASFRVVAHSITGRVSVDE